jgi:hypothetical protein
MINQHPITPPPELVQQWRKTSSTGEPHFSPQYLATQAARWGADQELEACAEWLDQNCGRCWELLAELRAARRPKPPSLKEQALLQLDTLSADLTMHGMGCDLFQIRRALETLDD